MRPRRAANTHVMILRSGRNTDLKLSIRSPRVLETKPSQRVPHVHNAPPKRKRVRRRRRLLLFYKPRNVQCYLNGKLHPEPAYPSPQMVWRKVQQHPIVSKLWNLYRRTIHIESSIWSTPSHSDNTSSRLLAPLPERIKKLFDDLHLPYYNSAQSEAGPEFDVEPSALLLSRRLGWSISHDHIIPTPSILKYQALEGDVALSVIPPSDSYRRETGPAMNLPPDEYPETAIDGHLDHEAQRFSEAGLIVPIEWEPFLKMTPSDVRGVSSDSNVAIVDISNLFLLPSPGAENLAAPQLLPVKSRTILHARTRMLWEAVHSLQSTRSEWRIDSSLVIADRDMRRHAGDVDRNRNSRNKESWAPHSIPKLLSYESPAFWTFRSDISEYHTDTSSLAEDASPPIPGYQMKAFPMELSPEYALGDILANLMTCDRLPVLRNAIIDSPRVMRCTNQKITLSMASLATSCDLQWEREQLPILFAAQHCLSGGGEALASGQIAHALHQTLLTLVLYYLDTRRALNEPLPPWMVIYGIIYHDRGYSIHAHFPVFHFSAADTGKWTQRTFGWAFYSRPVKTFHIFPAINRARQMEIASLLRIQSHALYVLRQLQEWTGYERTLRLLYDETDDE